MAVLLAQSAGAGAATLLLRGNVDYSAFFCFPSGSLSPEASAAAEGLLRLVHSDQTEERPSSRSEPCLRCLTPQAAPLPAVAMPTAPVFHRAADAAPEADGILPTMAAFALPSYRGPPGIRQ